MFHSFYGFVRVIGEMLADLIYGDYCTISTDRSWYVTRYLTCSRDTSFMTICYPLQPENLFILRSRNEKSD